MNLSIVIPNYNGEEILKKNLPFVYESVKNYKKGKVEIIIPDDPSTDKSAEVIQEFIKSLNNKNITGKTISNKDKNNAGFSKNVNRGVGLASGDILILLNTDVRPRPDFLEYLLSHFTDPNIFAVGCMDESIEGEKKVLRGRGIGKWIKGFLIHSKGNIDQKNTLWVSGGSGAFRKSIWDQIGGLDELYNPFYWEDIDLSYRALKSGYNINFENRSIVTHEHNKGAIKSAFKNSVITKIAYRNQFIFVWLNISDPKLLISHIVWLPFHLVNALLHGDLNLIYGFINAFKKINEVLKKRKKYSKLFTKSDNEILAKFTM